MTFYSCPQCKKRWSYFIDKCPYCFVALEKMKSERIFVSSVSKTNIPSPPHLNVPYYVLILEDENKNKWAFKTMKEYRAGDELKIEANENAVAVWRDKYDTLETIKKVLQFLGGLNLKENSKILIMPTLISPNHSYFRENTSPEFIKAVIELLKENKVKAENIKVAAQSFDETPIEAIAQKSGLLDVCLANQVSPLDLAKTNFIKKDNLEISEEILNADLILNCPILKMSRASASENILRALKKENYLGLKYLSSEKEMIENLIKILPNMVTVAEANYVQKTNKFATFLGLVFASKNPLNLDRVFNEITMANSAPETVKDIKLEDIAVVGREIKELKYNVELY